MKTGVELIAAERAEHVEKHGYTVQGDRSRNDDCELTDAAIGAISADSTKFPITWKLPYIKKICDKTYKERLILAGALIAAEIDRIS